MKYEVKQGDCLSSVAAKYGFHWEALWNHASNAKLKKKRKNPNVLYPGDIVNIPDKKPNAHSTATGKNHQFKVKDNRVEFKLRVLRDGKLRAGEAFELDVDGRVISGTTDGDGWVIAKIPPTAREGELSLADGKEQYKLAFGHIDPIDILSGIQGRLKNMGFFLGEVDGKNSAALKNAIRRFQAKQGLDETGEADQATKDKIVEAYEGGPLLP